MREKIQNRRGSVDALLDALYDDLATIEGYPHNKAGLAALAQEYDELFSGQIESGQAVLAKGTLLTSHANNVSCEESDSYVYGSFSGFETQNFFGQTFLVANIVPEGGLFDSEEPEDADKPMHAQLIVSTIEHHEFALFFDPNQELLPQKIAEWDSILRQVRLSGTNAFTGLKQALEAQFSEYVKNEELNTDRSLVENQLSAIRDISLYDIPALEYITFMNYNPADKKTLTVVCSGSLVSRNSNDPSKPELDLHPKVGPQKYSGDYQGMVIREQCKYGPDGNLISVIPRPYVAISEYLDGEVVLVPFLSIRQFSFGQPEVSVEQLPAQDRVSLETIELLEQIISDDLDT